MERRLKLPDTPGLADYLAAHAHQDAVLERVERETQARPDAQMQISPDQGALLTLLTRLTNAERALEVGTFTGYSAICIARGLPEDGTLTCLEVSPEFAEIAQRNLADAQLADKVTIEVGPADRSLLRMPAKGQFDFVFLDADKPAYPAYYDLIVPRMKPGALLLIDNMLLGGDVVHPDDERSRAIDALNGRIARDDRVDSALVLIADGVTFVRKRL